MSDIERLISRYLDRELSPEEEGTFHRILSESPEARRRLREMEAIRSAARRIPTLTMPTPQVESLLFQQLFAEESTLEESHSVEGPEREEPADRKAIPFLSRISATARRRTGVLAAALLFATLLGGGGFWFASEPGTNNTQGGPQIADASVRPAQAMPNAATEEETAQAAGISAPTSPFLADTVTKALAEDESTGINGELLQLPHPAAVHRGAQPALRQQTSKQRLNDGREQNEVLPQGSLPFAHNGTGGQNTQNTNVQGEENNTIDSWPPTSLNVLAENTLQGVANENRGNNNAVGPETDPLRQLSAPPANATIRYATQPFSSRHNTEQGISASYRHGLSYVEKSGSQFTAQDFSLRVEGRFDDRHRLSLSVGQSPLLVERTTRTLPTGIAVDPDGKGPSLTSIEQVEHFSKIADEVWAGIGYGYALVAGNRVRLEPGVSIGVGERSLRLSAELPIRYRLSNRFSLDFVASVSRVQPHDQILRDIDRDYDRLSFLHVDEEQHPIFTSVGASIGLSFDINK